MSNQEQVSPVVMEFYKELSQKLFVAMHQVLDSVSNEADQKNIGLAVVAQAAGGAFASALAEVTKDPENPNAIWTEEEKEVFDSLSDYFVEAYDQRLQDIQTMAAITPNTVQ